MGGLGRIERLRRSPSGDGLRRLLWRLGWRGGSFGICFGGGGGGLGLGLLGLLHGGGVGLVWVWCCLAGRKV